MPRVSKSVVVETVRVLCARPLTLARSLTSTPSTETTYKSDHKIPARSSQTRRPTRRPRPCSRPRSRFSAAALHRACPLLLRLVIAAIDLGSASASVSARTRKSVRNIVRARRGTIPSRKPTRELLLLLLRRCCLPKRFRLLASLVVMAVLTMAVLLALATMMMKTTTTKGRGSQWAIEVAGRVEVEKSASLRSRVVVHDSVSVTLEGEEGIQKYSTTEQLPSTHQTRLRFVRARTLPWRVRRLSGCGVYILSTLLLHLLLFLLLQLC